MGTDERYRRGFTLIEVTFATGILFLTLIMLLGALSHLALARELGERRHLATRCLNHCLEQLRSQPPASIADIQLSPPQGLPGEYVISATPVDDFDGVEAARIKVTTHATRGHAIEVEALYVLEGPPHAP